MDDKLIEAERKAKRELKLLISCFIALKHIHELVEKAEGDVGKVSDKQAKSEIKRIWRKLRTGIFGSAERTERKIARGYKDLVGEVKEAEVNLSPEEVEKINSIIGKSSVFNSLLERDASRGGAIEKALQKAIDAKDREERIRILKEDDEEILKDIETIEGFEIEMKEIIADIEEIEETRKRVATDLRSALRKMQDDLSSLIGAFRPVFGTGDIAKRKRIIAGVKSGLSQKGMTLLGVGGNGIVLKVNLVGKDYALKIATDLKNEIINLRRAQGIRGIPKFYFKTSVQEFDAILMELVIGEELDKYVKTHVLPDDFFDKVEKTVKQFHSRGMAHKDLNPDNIILVGEYPVFMDFGLSSPRASAAEKRFDDIFVEDLKLNYLKYTRRYRSNRRALAAAIQLIINGLNARLETETDGENRDTIEMFVGRAKRAA
jgi:hypothetical protein